ncbi:hypothetical protein VP01_2006g4 [Puccinia sorghi]|uniref:Uncharacterized protein n=1 Tax=Puccinia sorghi TaxID=27349 RepID=A0A0L6VBW5_9BASI|nr:hypothetical protein VP01_2006g4 [Puccinia sorghi]
MAKILKDQEKQAWQEKKTGQTTNKSLQLICSQSQPEDFEDQGKIFVKEDYKNSLSYLEDIKHYAYWYGEKTTVVSCSGIELLE